MALQHHSQRLFEVSTIYIDSFPLDLLKLEKKCQGSHIFSRSQFKNGKVLDQETSTLLYNVLKPYLPNTYTDARGITWSFGKSSRFIFFGEYSIGQSIGIHTDTGSFYSDNEQSKFTVLLCINDQFEGGETVFYDESYLYMTQIKLRKGEILFFDINLPHQSMPIKDGIKQWIGIEIVCKMLNRK